VVHHQDAAEIARSRTHNLTLNLTTMSDHIEAGTLDGLQEFATQGVRGQQPMTPKVCFERRKLSPQAKAFPVDNSSSRSSFVGPKKCSSPRTNAMRKRKSDELSRVDLSQLVFEQLSENSTEMAGLGNMGYAIFDSNSQWRNAFTHETDSNHDQNRAALVRPSREFDHSISLFDRIETTDSDLGKSTGSSAPVTPTLFRPPVTKQHSSFEGDSPCAVDALTRGCFSFWDRSLAWSEDDDDEYSIHEPQGKTGDVLDFLSVPKHLGVEDSPPQSEFYWPPSRSTARVRTLESASRHKLPSAKCFRQTDIDNVTEIHWEEKVLDTNALGMMAKLSL
jgi:hypothetical protein